MDIHDLGARLEFFEVASHFHQQNFQKSYRTQLTLKNKKFSALCPHLPHQIRAPR
jgi:hypothetical protein